jgi:hypothetical protein
VSNDIFDGDFNLPDTVYVLAPGPQGVPYYKDIDGYVIAVNKAICIDAVGRDLWLSWALAYRRWGYQWFRDAMSLGVVRCFGRTANADGLGDVEDCDYTFAFHPGYADDPIGLKPNVLCHGGSISIAAVQLCFWKGVKHCILVGCDFFGCNYYDGSTTHFRGHPVLNGEKLGKVWPEAYTAQLIINDCIAAGMKITSLSPTSLRVETVNAPL